MEIKRIVIHEIQKEKGVNEANLNLSESLTDVTDNVTFLSERLSDAFKKDEKVIRTEFIEEEDVFQIAINSFLNDKNDETFYEFTELAIKDLRKRLMSSTLATGGYFVFLNYETQNTEYIGVYIVRDTEEVIFNRSVDAGIFTVNKTTVINTSKLAMACRVDLNKLVAGQKRYLHFTHRQTEISDYFVNWIEARLANKSKDDTESLIKIINNIDRPIDPETNEEFEEDKFRTKIFDYINSIGRTVRVQDIGRNFWNDPDKIVDFAEENDYDINTEFQAVPSILKRLKKYEVKSGKIKLSFSHNDYNLGIIGVGDDNQVVINSTEIRKQVDKLFEEQ